jgi:hypothetical protein
VNFFIAKFIDFTKQYNLAITILSAAPNTVKYTPMISYALDRGRPPKSLCLYDTYIMIYATAMSGLM